MLSRRESVKYKKISYELTAYFQLFRQAGECGFLRKKQQSKIKSKICCGGSIAQLFRVTG
ncbi:hypothetical protein CSB69_1117 [Morganella morganii]|nr:hypothetical protein CSB69_1117 [Morganella morganii]